MASHPPLGNCRARQSSGPGGGQAEIVAAIARFRAAAASDGSTPLADALAQAPARYRRLLDFVEWKLIEMPLPRLQTIGDESVTFLYAINWTRSVRQGADKAGLEETHRRCVACR